jgi:hypothetical protein
MPNLARIQKRSNLSTTHATETGLERFFYNISLSAWGVPAGLAVKAISLLTAFSVLNRGGEVGYVGTRCTLAALAAFVVRVVPNARMSVSTLQRAVKELVEAGYLTVAHYGGGEARQCFNKRTTDFYWIRDQRVVLTLTDRALSLWSRGPVSHMKPPRSNCIGYELPSVSGSSLRSEPCKTLPRVCDRSVAAAVLEPSQTVEHDRTTGHDRTVDREACKPRGAVVDVRTFGEVEQVQGARSAGTPRANRSRGLRGTAPASRGLAARAILAALVVSLENHGRSGQRAIARAGLELADPRAQSSGVPWEYWIGRWGSLSQSERRSICRSTLFPLLLAAPPCAPSSPASGSPGAPAAPSSPASESPGAPAAPSSPGAESGSPGAPLEPVDVRAILREAADSNPFARELLHRDD